MAGRHRRRRLPGASRDERGGAGGDGGEGKGMVVGEEREGRMGKGKRGWGLEERGGRMELG